MMKVIIILAVTYVLLGIFVYSFHTQFIFQNVALSLDHRYAIAADFEEVWADETHSYHGLLFKNENPKGLILYFHGNRGNLERWAELTENLRSLEYDVLLVEFPSFGKSRAALTQENLWATAEIFMEYAIRNYAQENIIIYGRSMGTGLASWLSSKYKVKQLVLETPYTSLIDLIGKYIFFLPYKYLIKFNFEPIKYINSTKNDVLIIHGTEDFIIPVQMARKLASISPDKTKYIEIDGGKHDDLASYELYHKALLDVIR